MQIKLWGILLLRLSFFPSFFLHSFVSHSLRILVFPCLFMRLQMHKQIIHKRICSSAKERNETATGNDVCRSASFSRLVLYDQTVEDISQDGEEEERVAFNNQWQRGRSSSSLFLDSQPKDGAKTSKQGQGRRPKRKGKRDGDVGPCLSCLILSFFPSSACSGRRK